MARVRDAVLGIAMGVAVSSCGIAGVDTDRALTIDPTPAPFARVVAGQVQGLVPAGWAAEPLSTATGSPGGFVASPQPDAWTTIDGSVDGLSASWVDATVVGVPSDYYYLAATGPVLSDLVTSPHCRAQRQRVLLDRHPLPLPQGGPGPADFVAQGHGLCRIADEPVRWAYFVAAPGYGPVRRIGIPASGLYVVVAVVHGAGEARPLAQRLVMQATFGDSSVREIVAASRTVESG